MACCSSWGREESDTTVRLNLTELNRELLLGENKKDFLRSTDSQYELLEVHFYGKKFHSTDCI